jgi:hypothetical protein
MSLNKRVLLKVVEDNNAYCLFVKNPHTVNNFTLGETQEFPFFKMSKIFSYGIHFGYYFKVNDGLDVYEDSNFMFYKQSGKEEEPHQLFKDNNIFIYGSKTGFYIGVRQQNA